jgi:hypothetical protein
VRDPDSRVSKTVAQLLESKPFVPVSPHQAEIWRKNAIRSAEQSALGIALACAVLLLSLLSLLAKNIWQDATGSSGYAKIWWVPIALLLVGLFAGWGGHQFKRRSQYWYGWVEMGFALLSLLAAGGKLVHSLHDSEGQWVAGPTIAGAVYLVSRAFGNIAEGSERRRRLTEEQSEQTEPQQ